MKKLLRYFIILSGLIFNGVNLFLILICFEFLLFLIHLTSLTFFVYLDDLTGQIVAHGLVVAASCEFPIDLVITVLCYRLILICVWEYCLKNIRQKVKMPRSLYIWLNLCLSVEIVFLIYFYLLMRILM